MHAALNGSAWRKLGRGEEVLPASLLGTLDLLALLVFVYNTNVQILTRRKTLLDAHGNADLEIAPPARIERFNALREMQRGHYKSTMLTLLGAQFTCFTGTKVQILKYWYKSTNNRMRVA